MYNRLVVLTVCVNKRLKKKTSFLLLSSSKRKTPTVILTATIKPQIEGRAGRTGVDGGIMLRAVTIIVFVVNFVLHGKLSINGTVLFAGVTTISVSSFCKGKIKSCYGPNYFHRNYVLKSIISAAERLRIDFSVGHVALADSFI